MPGWLTFVIGMLVGANVGLVLFALCNINKKETSAPIENRKEEIKLLSKSFGGEYLTIDEANKRYSFPVGDNKKEFFDKIGDIMDRTQDQISIEIFIDDYGISYLHIITSRVG